MNMLLEVVVTTSEQVASTSKRLVKFELLANLLGNLEPDEIEIGVGYLTGVLRQGTIGVGYATLRDPAAPAAQPTLTLAETDGFLTAIAETSGPGSRAQRGRLLDDLMGRATEPEQQFLVRLILGDLRQGASEGVMVEAIARATAIPSTLVRRAVLLRGDLRAVARTALTQGPEALEEIGLEVLRPLLPMLAQTAASVESALETLSPAAIEWKIDGARLQAHRQGDEIRIFTRNLADITDRLPEIVETLQGLEVESIVLDGEVIALQPDRRPQPFQVTMSRFGSKVNAAQMAVELPLTPFFFDCLHLNGQDLIDRPSTARTAALEEAVPSRHRVPREIVDEIETAQSFFDRALDCGHEGVMIKSLDAAYEAGRRGSGWLKVKPVHSLDLVVLAVEWGSGRRQGWLSNLHLGARDPQTGGFVMLGKTFKGLTDETLQWQTERFLGLETHREGHIVHVRPEQVVEIAFDGIQASTRYPGAMALRFARVKGYRPDKTAEGADTIETVRALFERTSG
jgi:DNA ligase-1